MLVFTRTEECKTWLFKISESVSGYPRMYIDRTIAVLKADEMFFEGKDGEVDSDDVEL